MKRIILFSLILIASTAIIAQEDDEFETIFGQDTQFSGFGGPWMNFTTLNGEFAHMMGGGGGVLLNSSFYFGGYGYGLTNQINYQGDKLDFGYGGLMTGYIFNSNEALHPMIGFQMGWGDISMKDTELSDQVYVLNPIVELEMNLTQYFKIGVGAGYRYVSGVDNIGTLANSDFSGFSGRLSFYFGWF
jgi:hypothetical protein